MESKENLWVAHGAKFSYPEVGEVVTIKTINEWTYGTLVTLYEHDNSHLVGKYGRVEPGFGIEHFRPLVERKTDISIFTKMLNPDHADA